MRKVKLEIQDQLAQLVRKVKLEIQDQLAQLDQLVLLQLLKDLLDRKAILVQLVQK